MSRTQARSLHIVAKDPSPVRESSSGKSSVLEQLKDFRSNIPKDKLTEWEGYGLAPSYVYLATNVRYVPNCYGSHGWGQRGLSNLAHDAIHRNLTRSKKLNELLADASLASPLMSTAYLQRQAHTAHHHYQARRMTRPRAA
ncbi:hypothetical protein BU15DRAFT_76374 [Melanogaster broomeanus]|nr:hypothetical protein BU15DRAFT_76374 [Melanogaster broomeanus]